MPRRTRLQREEFMVVIVDIDTDQVENMILVIADMIEQAVAQPILGRQAVMVGEVEAWHFLEQGVVE